MNTNSLAFSFVLFKVHIRRSYTFPFVLSFSSYPVPSFSVKYQEKEVFPTILHRYIFVKILSWQLSAGSLPAIRGPQLLWPVMPSISVNEKRARFVLLLESVRFLKKLGHTASSGAQQGTALLCVWLGWTRSCLLLRVIQHWSSQEMLQVL